MLIGKRGEHGDGPADLVDLLIECHDRIRRFIALAHEAGVRYDAPDSEIVDACARVERYFSEALPLHVEDEEESILPRLVGKCEEVDRALTTMETQHTLHEPKVLALLQASNAVRREPGSKTGRNGLASAASDLEHAFVEHLTLEESVIFPAVRRFLDEETTATILLELRQRRVPRSKS